MFSLIAGLTLSAPLSLWKSNADASGGVVDVTWKDCGAQHVVVTGVSPSQFKLGEDTIITGEGDLDDTETGGTYTMKMTGIGGVSLLDCSGDAATPKKCSIGLGPISVGSLSYQ